MKEPEPVDWRAVMPDAADLHDAGFAYQAGDYVKALTLVNRALAAAVAAGNADVAGLIAPFLAMCQAKVAGTPLRPAEPACALCCSEEDVPAHEADTLWLCPACVPRCRTRIQDLQSSGELHQQRWPPKDPQHHGRCSFCGVGADLMKAIFGAADTGALCYECLEDFTEQFAVRRS
jgi:hypothetical protein